MKVKVTEECIGCGACVAIAPEVFEMNSETMKSIVKKQPSKDEEQKTKDAANACPVNAIKISE